MFKIYKVNNNETLASIASKLGIEKERLLELNGFDSNHEVVVGDFIIVPTMDTNMFHKYIVKKGDNMYRIAEDNNVDYKMLLSINGLDEDDYIYENQEIIIPNKNVKVYVTKENDTFDVIAQSMNENICDIINQNGNILIKEDQLVAYKKEQN